MPCRWMWAVFVVTALGGCTELAEKQSSGSAGASASGCVDLDNDGLGEGCSAGRDCDDRNPSVTDQCFGACSEPSNGCPCNGEAPVPCFLDSSANPDGTTMCHEGTRHCRAGTWGVCEDVHSYSVAPRQDTRLLPDVVRRNTCSDCDLNCFVARDGLEFVDGGIPMAWANPEVEQIPAGGITKRRSSDAGVMVVDAGPGMFPDGAVSVWPIPDAGPCLVGDPLDTDCDNIPNYYDPNPTVRTIPFDSPHPTIVATTANNISVNVDINTFEFRLTEADVYFALDVTRNQDVERQAFIDAINNTTTDFVTQVHNNQVPPVPLADRLCVDVDGNGIADDDYLKGEGLIGAIRCFTGDAYLGMGFINEVPVHDACSIPYGGTTINGTTYGGTVWNECHYGESNRLSIPFRNLFDLSPDFAGFRSRVWGLPRIPTRLEIPQAGTQALWALARGESGDLYYGPSRPAFGARRDCPAGTYGGACFRSGVLPFTFLFTDTGQHNGPLNYIPTGYKPRLTNNSNPTYAGAPYAAANLTLTDLPGDPWGTPHAGGERARHLPKTNETVFTPFDVGPLTNQRLTFTGSTVGMTGDMTAAGMNAGGMCSAAGNAPDAFISFDTTAANTPVTITLTETPHDSNGANGFTPTTFPKIMSLFPNVVSPMTTAIGMSNNIGPLDATRHILTGDTSGFIPGYLGNVSHCGADGTTGQATVTFTATAASITAMSGLLGGGSQAVVDIYDGTPPGNPGVTDLVALGQNTNDTFATPALIDLGATPYQTIAGNTSTLPLDISGNTVGCGINVSANPVNDAVFRVRMPAGGARTIKIDTEGSAIDTVISLHSAPPIVPQTIPVNNTDADTTAGFNMGVAQNAVTVLEGDTTGASAKFAGTSSAAPCFAGIPDAAPDHAIAFSMGSLGTLRMKELANGENGFANVSDPAVAIYLNAAPVSSVLMAPYSGNGTSVANAYELGALPGVIQLSGYPLTDAETHPAPDLFSGCGAFPPAAGAADVVYHFNSPTALSNVTFTAAGTWNGSTGTRPMMALFATSNIEYTAQNGGDAHPGTGITLPSSSGVVLLSGTTVGFNKDYSQYGIGGIPAGVAWNATGVDTIYRVVNPVMQDVTFRLDSSAPTAFDPTLRLFPEATPGVGAVPWVNGALTPSEGISVAVPPTVTGRILRGSGTFGTGSQSALDNAEFNGCAGIVNTSRDSFFLFEVTGASPRRLWFRANGANDSRPDLMIFPTGLANYNTSLPYPTAATNVATGSPIPCTLGDGANNATVTATLNPGTYYAVVKAHSSHDPDPCGILGNGCGGGFLVCGTTCSNNWYQDDAFTLDVVDVTATQAEIDGNNNATHAQINRSLLPAGTYSLVVTSQGAAGTYKLRAGPGAIPFPAPQVCSANTMAGGVTTISRTAAQADTLTNAASNPLPTVANAWIQVDSDFGAAGWSDNSNLCGADNSSRDAFYQFTLTRTSTLQLDAWGDGDTDAGVTVLASSAGDPATLANRALDTSATPVACSSGGGTRTVTTTLPAGTYYAVVKAHLAHDDDPCGLLGSGCGGGFLVCSDPCANNWWQDDPVHLRIRDLTETGTHHLTVPTINAGQDYYLVVKGMNGNTGNYNLNVGSQTVPHACLPPNFQQDITSIPAGTHYAVVKGATAGTYALSIGETGAALDNRVACDDNSGPGTSSSLEYTVPASGVPLDYYLVVKGKTIGQEGAYRVNIRDQNTRPDNWVACANSSTTMGLPTAALTAGNTYTAVIKGSDGVGGPASVLLYDASYVPTATACSTTTSISTTLTTAGRHVIGIKGLNAGNPDGEGAYQLTIAAGTPPAGTTTERSFLSKTWGSVRNELRSRGMKVVPLQSCEPNTDWGTGTGDPTNGGNSGQFNACGSTFGGPAAFLLQLLSLLALIPFVGCLIFGIIAIVFLLLGLVTSNPTSYVPPNANPASCDVGGATTEAANAAADAVYASVQNPVNLTPQRGAWPQSQEIARATDTVSSSGTPTAYWLQRNPSANTVGYDIAEALYRLTSQLLMDVSLELVWDSVTTPGYLVNVTPVAPAMDACASISGTRHVDCAVGDKPGFTVSFTNPGATPVPESTPADFSPAADWRGAWPGRLVVLGDGQFVLDEYPVLLIPPVPAMMVPPPPPPRYTNVPAVYRQNIHTRECDGTLLPDWSDLYFTAEMPPGTTIEFEACAGDTIADLSACTMQTVATVTATNVPCFTDAQCRGMNGYCGPAGSGIPSFYCRTISPPKAKGLCSSEAECPDGTLNDINGAPLLGDCVSGECTYDSQPADLGAALGADNFRRYSRMEITLTPDPALTYAPNLLEWAATYVCTPSL